MSTRADPKAPLVVVALAVAFIVAGLIALGRAGELAPPAAASATPTVRPGDVARPPEVVITQDTCCAQTARFLRASWTSSQAVQRAAIRVLPDPGFDCGAAIGPDATQGTFGCVGLLRGATDYVATLTLTTAAGSYPFERRFKTMGDALRNVQWFTEFEDPKADPLACAAASCRIIQLYTTGKDPMTAQGILDLGKQFNRSRDPGLDPAAIASVLSRLDARNRYHYYRLESREEATKSAIYWLVRSGKPVMVISLAGQHGPLLIGFNGSFGTFYGDPANAWSGVVVEDPQRGDVRPETANRRPDKYRTAGFQTGQLLGLDEWYRDEWWLGFAYQANIKMPDGSVVNVERNDGVYPTPHWAGRFVIIVDDGDAENPPDREGRVQFR